MQSEGNEVESPSELMSHVHDLKHTTRRRLQAEGWQWLLVWSVVCLGAAISGAGPWAPSVAGWYWPAAVPIALAVTWWLDARLAARRPVRRKDWPYWLTGAGIALLAFGGGAVFSGEVMVVWVWVVFGLGFMMFALLERQPAAAWLMAVMATLSAVLGLVVEDTFLLYPVLALAFGGALAGVAAGIKAQADRA